MKNFWDFKAKKYPKPFNENILKETENIISRIEKLGVDFNAQDIIDIGCGTGVYGLALSKKAKNVLCLDFSQEMIKILKNEASIKKIRNCKCLRADFQKWDIGNFHKKFDIAFASMTPAIKTSEDIEKMGNLAREFCVFIGWAGKRENLLSNEIFKMHKINPFIPKGFIIAKDILKEKNIEFKEDVFETSWLWKGTIDEAVEEFSRRIELDGARADIKLIKDFLHKKFPSGEVEMTTCAREGIIVWRP